MNKSLLVSAALVGLLFAAAPASATVVGCTAVPECSTGDVEVSGDTTTVGDSSGGTLTITGAYTTGTLIAGSAVGVTGTVSVTTMGSLTDDAIIGDAGTGNFTNNGTQNVTGNLIVGNQSTGNGTYTITGSSAVTNVNFNSSSETPNGALIVGNAGTGSFTQETFVGSDATPAVNVAGDLALGLQSGSTGTYTVNDGTLTVGGAMIVGAASTNANQFTQNGGTVNLTGSASGNSLYAPVSPGAVPATSPGSLYIGGESVTDNGAGTYTMTGGNLNVNAGNIYVGYSGTGTVNQSGGAVATNYLDMGFCGGCNGGNSAGFYNLTGTGTIVTGAETVGDFGHGEFVQGSDDLGTTVNTVNGTLAIGNSPTATPNVANAGSFDRSGTYTLDSGTLSTVDTVVGSQGTGTFIQNGGTHSISDTLDVGQQYTTPSGTLGSGTPSDPVFGGPALGTYDMNGGTLTANNGITVGDSGNGTFNHTGGTVTSGVSGPSGNEGDLIIGNQGGIDAIGSTPAQPGGQGTYYLGQTGQTQTPTLQVYGDTILGQGTSTSGANPANGTLAIAGDGTAMSVNAYSCCAPQNGGNILIGLNGTGAVTQTDQSSLYLDHYLVLGANAGGSGTYTLSATSTTANSGYNLLVGSDLDVGGYNPATDIYGYNPQTTSAGGTGMFTQASGDIFVVGSANIGNSGGTGTYALSGGTFTSGNNLYIGNNAGTGSFNQTGGAATVGTPGSDGTLGLGTSGGVGTYSLTGASTLTVNGSVNIAVDPGSDGSSMTIGTGSDSPVMLVQSTIGNGNMVVGGSAAGSLTINSGSVTVQAVTYVGYFGTGTVIQSGGTFESGYLDVGIINSTGNTYTLSNGTVNVDNDLVVGNFAGSGGTFTQASGTVNVNSGGFGVYINNGTYDLQSGNFNVVNSVTVGDAAGGASFTQEGGTASLGNNLIVGNRSGVTGSYTIGTGGTLTIGTNTANAAFGNYGSPQNSLVLGNSGTGTFTQNGGTVTIGGDTLASSGLPAVQDLILGTSTGSSGTYNMNGGNLTVYGNANFNNSSIEVGFIDGIGGGGTGQFTQTGGTVNTYGVNGLAIGDNGAATGSGNYSISGGSLNINANPTIATNGFDSNSTGNLFVGANETGSMTQSGGSVSVAGDAFVGFGTGASGTWTINNSAGTPAVSVGGDMYVGGTTLFAGTTGTGEVDQSAGTATVAGKLDVGAGPFSTGTYNLSDTGTLTVGSVSTPGTMIVGDAGTGTFNNTGASNTVNGDLTVGAAGTGTYNLGNGAAGATLNVLGSGLSGGNVFVGESGTGTITASDGAVATIDGALALGGPSPGESGGNGTLTVTGSGTEWLNSGQVQVGGFGTGTLNVLAGGYLKSQPGGSGSGSSGVVGEETGSQGTATVDGAGSEWNNTGALRVGVFSAGTGVAGNLLTISNGGLVVDNAGTDGAAASVGWQAGSIGTVNIVTGGTWTNNGAVVIGDAGTGTVSIDGSTGSSMSVGGNLILGNLAGSNGTLTFANAASLSLTSGTQFIVGNSGTGVVNQNGGDLNLTTAGVTLDIGAQIGSHGTYNLNGGSLQDDLVVGDAGTGTFNNNGMAHTVNGNLILGNQSTGNGTYNLTLGGTTTVTGYTTVGNAGTGTFLNDASTLNSQGALIIAAQNSSNGGFTLQDGGTVNVGVTGAAAFMDVAENGTGTYTQSSGTTNIIGALDIGRCGSVATATCNNGSNPYTGTAGNGMLNLSGGSMTVSYDSGSNYGGFAKVGDAGTGSFNISGGASFTTNYLGLAEDGGTGTVTLNGSASTVTLGALGVGDDGTGTFTQNAGTVTVNGGGLTIGRNASAPDPVISSTILPAGNGTYNLNGGTLSVTGGEYVGAAGTGTLNQSAGLNTADSVSIGNNTGGTGTYNLSGTGTLTDTGTLYVGSAGNGTLNQSGGSIAATGLSVGNDQGGVGNYNLSAGSLAINGTTDLGDGIPSPSQGTINQGGGTAAFNGDVNVGVTAGGTGTYTLGGSGVATIAGNLDIGVEAGSSGTFNFNTTAGDVATLSFTTSGKTMTVGDAGNGTVNQGGGNLNLNGQGITLDIGAQQGSNGHYNMTGGSLQDDLIVGDAGTGTFTNTGGAHTVTGNLIIGNQPTGNGTYTLGGTGNLTLGTTGAQIILGNAAGASGTFNFNTSAGDAGTIAFSGTGDHIIVGNNGNGVFTQGGGDLNLTGAGASMDIAALSGSFGQYNLRGGTLETGSLNVGDAGSGQFNQSGGTGTINGNLVVANQSGSLGVVSIGGPGATSLTVTGNATIGNNAFGSFSMAAGATVDVQGSMTVANSAAGGSVGLSGGSLTVGNGGTGNQLLITSSGSMNIQDTGGASPSGASVTVDGNVINNGQIGLGLHDATPSATLTVTGGGLQNNGGFNFEGNAVLNANVTNGSATNNSASFSAQNGSFIPGSATNVTLNGNMDNFASVNVSSLGITSSTLTQNGNFTNEATGTFDSIGSNVTINGSGTALDNKGTVTFSEDVNGPTAPISTVAITGNVLNEGTGTMTMTDAHVTVTGNVDNFGQFTAQRDAGSVNVASNVTVSGTLTNEALATLTVASSSMTVNGATTNNGTVNVSNSTVFWNATFTNNGAYNSDPSTSHFIDLNVGALGYLTGGTGDVFDVSGNFHNTSTQNTLWSTSGATLEFSGSSGTVHDMDLVGLDDGPNASGYTDNYAWGLLELDAGNSLSLDGTPTTDALYVLALAGLEISGDDILNIDGNGLNIYYNPSDDAALDDLTYALADGGLLCPVGSTCTLSTSPPPPTVPEPGSLLLFGGGLAGLAFVRRRVARLKGRVSAR